MGMFDTIYGNFFCPYCGKKTSDFQTKGLECALDSYKWNRLSSLDGSRETIEMHTSCESCNEWVELIVRKKQLTKGVSKWKKLRNTKSFFQNKSKNS